MHVEDSVTVPKAAVHNREFHEQLVEEARGRLIELGLATREQLAAEPAMATSDGDAASPWVNVTFTWHRD
jgi:hypothetical protein